VNWIEERHDVWGVVIGFLESYKDFLNICFVVPVLYAHCTRYPKIIEHLIADCNFDKKLFMSHTDEDLNKIPDHVRNVIIRKTAHKDERMFPMYFEVFLKKEKEINVCTIRKSNMMMTVL